jgi:hypothetical protein
VGDTSSNIYHICTGTGRFPPQSIIIQGLVSPTQIVRFDSLDSCTMCPFSNSAVLEAQWHELEALFTDAKVVDHICTGTGRFPPQSIIIQGLVSPTQIVRFDTLGAVPLQSLDSCTMCPFSNSAVLEAQWHELEALFTDAKVRHWQVPPTVHYHTGPCIPHADCPLRYPWRGAHLWPRGNTPVAVQSN